MSRAFVDEDAQPIGVTVLPDRRISPHPNLVTRRGLSAIERAVAEHARGLARATAAEDAEGVSRASRELRYWNARHATAQLAEPPPSASSVVFGVAVTGAGEDGSERTFRIVGEDEADPAQGRIAWTTPVARALLGGEPGETRQLPTGAFEILAIDATPEPAG
ncbi:MAG TPA: GreA/GreB family elongation factor [Geminicoccaceae bacterium]|nr:GreA/GreB family elongation factor [Geminicoccaceae bacterium]